MNTRNPTGKGGLEARWQKHVMEGLWVALALLILLSIALVYAEAYGFFNAIGDKPPMTSWPVGWP